MKNIMRLFVVCLMLILGTQVSFANSDKETLQEGADLTSIHRLALAMPLYQQVEKDAPDKAELSKIFYDASRVSRLSVASYNTVADSINSTKSIDILALDRRTAAKYFKENVADYANAYVVLTVANNSRTSFFFDVYQSGTNQLLYTYEIQANRSEKDSVVTFNNLCEQFYKHLERATAAQLKEKNKK